MTKGFAVMTLMATILFISATVQASVGFDFAADTQGWAAEDWGNGLPTLSWTSWSGGTLEVNSSTLILDGSNWAKTYLKGDLATPQDLTSTSIYTLDIWIPGTISGIAKLAVRTGSGGDLYESGALPLTQWTWQTLSWDLSGVGNLYDVRQFGIEVQAYFPPSGDTFNIDNVSANPIPEPASLLLLGTGLVGIFGFSLKRKGVK